jgi:ribosome-binding protein aMBF1 (putative translation factor)
MGLGLKVSTMYTRFLPWETAMAAKDFGTWLKVERQAREWTQAEMAAAIGVSTNSVARWERGEVTPTPLAQSGIRSALAEHDKRRGRRG